MRIQIKVYIDAEKDKDCAGIKPHFWVSADTVFGAIEELENLQKPIDEALLGIKPEPEDFSGVGDEER